MSRSYYMGSDPEFGFMRVEEGKEVGLVPCALYLPPKRKPITAPAFVEQFQGSRGHGVRVDHDGWNGEFQHNPYACHGWLMDTDYIGLLTAKEQAEKNGFKLFIGDVGRIDASFMPKAPREALESGCNTTLNGFDGGTPCAVLPNFVEVLQTYGCLLGGHIHFGICNGDSSPLSQQQGVELAKLMLLTSVLPMSIATFTPEQKIRYRVLGVGMFRLPEHGIEFKDFGSATLRSCIHRAAAYGYARTTMTMYDYAFIRNGSISARDFSASTIKSIYSIASPDEAAAALIEGDLDHMWHIYNRIKQAMCSFSEWNGDDNSPWLPHALTRERPLVDDWEMFMKNPNLAGENLEDGWRMEERYNIGHERCFDRSITRRFAKLGTL